MKKITMLFATLILATGIFAQENKTKMDHKMKDCVMMKDGKMVVMKEGKTMDMDEDMTMQNGAMVMKDGTVKWKNGKTTKLKEGDCVYMDGKMAKMKMDKKKEKMK
jgi:hypothetical protein